MDVVTTAEQDEAISQAAMAARTIQDAFEKVNFFLSKREYKCKPIVCLDSVLEQAAFVALPMYYRAIAVCDPFEGLGGRYSLSVIPRSLDWKHYKADGNEVPLFGKVLVERSEQGVLQACALLFCSKTWMPLYWHAGYDRSEFFFTQEQFDAFVAKNKNGFDDEIVDSSVMNPSDSPLAAIFKEKDLVPRASFGRGWALASIAMWNDWGGLELWKPRFRLTASGYIDPDSYDFETETLYEYNCGICY